LLARADVVLEGFRPGVAARLGVGPDDARQDAIYCSITGFGTEGRHAARPGHDLNYLGWAGALADTAPAMPPLQIADLAAGALGAVTQILAALLEGGGARLTVSMTHGAHDLVAHRVGGEPVPKLLTGGVACYRIYETADGRFLTVGALEPKFWARLCELVGLPELSGRQWEPNLPELEQTFASRPLADWLDLFDGEDVSAGPVATLAEAAREFASGDQLGPAPRIGEHTDAWRTELGL
jgi:crotonobetainyl-CoA:carnitine CoA-transferase CaiB-like acyl-CoA transferase